MRPSTPTLRATTRLPAGRPTRAAMHAARAAPPRDGGLGSLLSEFKLNSQALLDRHDFGSAACGALAVTTLAVARGQDPLTAASITAAATVTALVVNDLMANDA